MAYTDKSPMPAFALGFLRQRWTLFLLMRVLALALLSAALAFTQSIMKPGVWRGFRQTVSERAQIDILEDFRGGLDSWQGDENLINTWSYDPSGLVIPGRLALLTASMSLTDYDIDSRIEIITSGIGLAGNARNSVESSDSGVTHSTTPFSV